MSNNDIPTGGKRFGYFLSILINFAMIYIANNLLVWNVPFLTNDFIRCLWAINLSFAVTIFTNFIFIFFDRKWFHSLMEAFGTVFSFLSTYVFWQVFPLDINETWSYWVKNRFGRSAGSDCAVLYFADYARHSTIPPQRIRLR